MLHKISITYDIITNVFREIFDNNYSVFKEDYMPEDQIKKCLQKYKSSYFHDLFVNYFKPEAHNIDSLPSGGSLIVGNHSFPGWDGLSVLHSLFENYDKITYSLIFKGMSSSNWISWFKTLGMVEGTPKMANKLLSLDKIVQVFPGGIEDALKTVKFRYKVRPVGGFAKGRQGYLKVAQQSGKSIIPMGIVGADEAHYILGHAQSIIHPVMKQINNSKYFDDNSWFKNLAKGVLGCKIVPIPLNIIPLNKKIDIYFGEPIKIKQKDNLDKINKIVMREIQELINYGLDKKISNT